MSLDLINEFAKEQQPEAQNPSEMQGNESDAEKTVNQNDGASEMDDTNTPNEGGDDTATENQNETPDNPDEGSQENSDDTSQEQVDQTTQFDWNVLSERSNGLIKDEETFTNSLEKLSKFEEVSNKVTELESNQFKPASDFVSKLNDFVKNGATPEQVKQFVEISTIGDLSALDPKEILIKKEMLLNGADRDVAEYSVDNKYDFALHEEGSVEYKHLQHQMSVESRNALNELNQYKSDLTKIENTEAIAQEEARLQSVAQEKERMYFVKREAPKMASSFASKISFEVDKDKVFDHGFSDDFKKNMESKIVQFFDTTKLPLNDENLGRVADYLELTYIQENKNNIFKDMYNKITSEVEERLANKYQNISGAPEDKSNPRPQTTQSQLTEKQIQDKAAKSLGII